MRSYFFGLTKGTNALELGSVACEFDRINGEREDWSEAVELADNSLNPLDLVIEEEGLVETLEKRPVDARATFRSPMHTVGRWLKHIASTGGRIANCDVENVRGNGRMVFGYTYRLESMDVPTSSRPKLARDDRGLPQWKRFRQEMRTFNKHRKVLGGKTLEQWLRATLGRKSSAVVSNKLTSATRSRHVAASVA